MFGSLVAKNSYVTSTPKSSLDGSNQLTKMEQSNKSMHESSTTKVTYHSASASSAPSSYQAMFGHKNKSYSRGGLSTYGYAGEGYISATSVNASFAQMPGILNTRREEKQELSVLNDRFATYIDKVRRLEGENKILSAKIVELESTRMVVSRSGDMYEDELARLRREIERLTHEKAEVEIQLHNCVQDLASLEKKLQMEIEIRREAERDVKSLRKDVDNATLARIDLERKLETVQEELELLKATTIEDIETMKSQVSVKHEEVFDASGPSTNLTESLRDIRVAYEHLSTNNTMDVEKLYKTTIADLQFQNKTVNQAHAETKAELMDKRRQLQIVTVESEGLRSTNSSLEQQIAELQDRLESEGRLAQSRISELEIEKQKSHDQMVRHLAEYNKLMNVKLSLDLEIATYRKLLEGEEGRISRSASMEQSGYSTIEKTTTEEYSLSVSSAKSVGKPQILLKEEVTTKTSSSSSESDSD